MSNRLPCINPRCRRTAAAEKYPGSDEIICNGCYKSLPPALRQRWKTLTGRNRKLNRLHKKGAYRVPERNRQWWRISIRYDRAWTAFWLSLKLYFNQSETPVGIEDFLKENGIV
ncbi:hypothetical protein [Ciceribacter sp. L1K22]|uniref:hypothetical protein n=1 Tax=Ciceribacter sp. L1K22 TaxID=2820275 RepID=UPI001ABE416F|nr:hypothetical protein [Ciceribacter sp. L1K22]MBO3760398.1 hypothetical protein [Ciceribacter sp. L1K22]